MQAASKRMQAYRQLRRISAPEIRNLIRGIVATPSDGIPDPNAMNSIRLRASEDDLATSAQLILGSEGLYPLSNIGGTYRNLVNGHSLAPISARAEAAFTCGYLNGWIANVKTIIKTLGLLSELAAADGDDAANSLLAFVRHFGASSLVSRKLAFLAARHGEEAHVASVVKEISVLLRQDQAPQPFFSSLEIMENEHSYFTRAQTRIAANSKYISGDPRKLIVLTDLIPVPLSEADIGPFLRKAHSSSLVDNIAAVITLLNSPEEWPSVASVINDKLSSEILDSILEFQKIEFDASSLYSDKKAGAADSAYYRRSLAFTEFKKPSSYRLFVDRVLAPRLLTKYIPAQVAALPALQVTRRDLTRARLGFIKPDDYLTTQNVGVFLRTIHFLTFIRDPNVIPNINENDMRYICENTISLDVLLSENEIESFYASASSESKPLVTVLALALHKARNADDDVDFKFRFALCNLLKLHFESSIEKFAEWLLPRSPEIANYLIFVLDRPTIQKLYWIVKSADQADRIRQSLLRVVGKQRNEISYLVEADAIEAQRQVSKLRQYFDDSRVFVDGVAMKHWLVSNPSSYAQQYLKIVEHQTGRTTAASGQIDEQGRIRITGTIEIDTIIAYDYILLEALRLAFVQFCVNRDFGIESYLGRRIRHNTLAGMMREGVEDLIEAPAYRNLMFDNAFAKSHEEWILAYRRFIENLRTIQLQFRTDARPNGILSSSLKDDDSTRVGVASTRNMIAGSRNIDLMNDLIIMYCWTQIDPQLQSAAKLISVDLVQHVNELIEAKFGSFSGESYGQYRTQLREAVHVRLTRLASWFRRPEDGFISASVRELGELIKIEAQDGKLSDQIGVAWAGSATDLRLDGLSVHRMYDCLSVLVRNAFSYGDAGKPVTITVDHSYGVIENISGLLVSVSSTFRNDREKKKHVERLRNAFASDDVGAAMTTEGYSGIRKIRYITRTGGGGIEAGYCVSGDECIVLFSLAVQLAAAEQDAS